jgi:hypothetical protein
MLPPHMVNPSVERVVGYITGRIEPGSDEEQDKLTDGKEATAATDDDTETAPAPAAKLTSAQRIAASRAAAKKS